MRFEGQESFEKVTKPEGVSFETELGKSFNSVGINFSDKELSVREAFPDRSDLRAIIAQGKKFKLDYPGTFNGVLLGNMNIESESAERLDLSAQKLHYYIYFAAHQLRQDDPENLNERYGALSTCGLVYDKARKCFYMSVRPSDSQEQGGMIGTPGGVLNPDFYNANPFETIRDRFYKKLSLDPDTIKCLGLERIFDEHYSLYDLAMYGEVDGQEPKVNPEKFEAISLDQVEEFLLGDRLTSPAKATILLALSQGDFEQYGWGKERIKKIMEM